MKKDILSSFSSNKKKKLYRAIKKSNLKISNRALILSLLDNDTLDNTIKKIDKSDVKVIKSPLIKKGYLTGYEQFISILDKFISYALDLIYNHELIEIILMNLSDKKILLSKRYVYDAENIEYYQYNFNYLIVYNFFNNLIKLKKDLSIELKKINLELDNMNLDNIVDTQKLVNIISEIIFINKNNYIISSLFTSISEERYQLFLDWYKFLLHKYIENMNFIYAYREFKNVI